MECNLLTLAKEIWHSDIIPMLYLKDVCRLDSAVQNYGLRWLFHCAAADAQLVGESIIFPESLHWLQRIRLKPLCVKLDKQRSVQIFDELAEYCPQIVSVSSCYLFDADEVSYVAVGETQSFADFLTTCKSLKRLRFYFAGSMVNETEETQWWWIDFEENVTYEDITYETPRRYHLRRIIF